MARPVQLEFLAEHEKVSIVPNFTLMLPGGELRLIEVGVWSVYSWVGEAGYSRAEGPCVHEPSLHRLVAPGVLSVTPCPFPPPPVPLEHLHRASMVRSAPTFLWRCPCTSPSRCTGGASAASSRPPGWTEPTYDVRSTRQT